MSDSRLEFLKKLHDESMRLLGAAKFDKRDEQDRLVASLYVSMIEQAGSIIFLVDKLKDAGVSAIFRSMLEAYVDLKNLINDAEYVGHLNARYYEELLRLMKEGHNKNNAFLAGLKDQDAFDERLEDFETKLTALKARKCCPLKIFEKFKMADLEDVYRSYYNILCADTHNDIRALIDRHIEVNGDDFEVVGYREVTLVDFEAILDSAAGSLMDATCAVHAYSRSTIKAELDALQTELEAVRKK